MAKEKMKEKVVTMDELREMVNNLDDETLITVNFDDPPEPENEE